MTKKTEYLILVHLDVETVNGLEAIFILFVQPADLEYLLLFLFLINLRRELLVALRVHAQRFELHRLLYTVELVLASCFNADNANLSLLLLVAAPEIGGEAEAQVLATSIGLRGNLLEVEAQEDDPDAV